MKFLLYQVSAEQTNNPGFFLNSLNTNNNRLSSNRLAETAKPDLILNCESIAEPLQIVNIKDFIAQSKKIRIENIGVYINPYVDQDISYGLPDEFDLLKLFNNKILNTKFLSVASTMNSSVMTSKENSSDTPKLYFKVLNDIPLVKIVIEFFLTNIDKILMEVSANCSVYILKYLLRKKLLIPESEQNLIDMETHKPFKNDDIISNVIGSGNAADNNNGTMRVNNSQMNYQSTAQNKAENLNGSEMNNNNINNNNENRNEFYNKNFNSKILKIQLIRKGNRRCSIGIDFSFNILKDIKKIEFSDQAPSFREASDGLNILCYCKNRNCKIFEQLFVENKGCGRFDLLKEIALIKCPRCNTNKIEARNLGFIFCEWSYRGYLTNKKNSCTSGDGLTIDDKLYVLNEVILNQQIEKLDILVKERIYVQPKIIENDPDGEIDSDGNIDYDSIGLESIRSCHYKDSKIQSLNLNNIFNNSYDTDFNLNNKLRNQNNWKEQINTNDKVNSVKVSDSKLKSKFNNLKDENNNKDIYKNIDEQNNKQFNSVNNVGYENPNRITNHGNNKTNNNINFGKNYGINKNINKISNVAENIKFENDNSNSLNNSFDGSLMNGNNSNKNFILVKTKTQELEIITEKQPKFELTNCITLFGKRNNNEKNNQNKLSKIKSENHCATENNEKCLIF